MRPRFRPPPPPCVEENDGGKKEEGDSILCDNLNHTSKYYFCDPDSPRVHPCSEERGIKQNVSHTKEEKKYLALLV